MSQLMRSVGLAVVLFVGAALAAARSVVVDTQYVKQVLKSGAIVWDARDAADYADEHIPGAVNIGWAGDLFRDQNREDPPSAAAASKIFGGAGMDILNKEVVVYTTKGDPFSH